MICQYIEDKEDGFGARADLQGPDQLRPARRQGAATTPPATARPRAGRCRTRWLMSACERRVSSPSTLLWGRVRPGVCSTPPSRPSGWLGAPLSGACGPWGWSVSGRDARCAPHGPRPAHASPRTWSAATSPPSIRIGGGSWTYAYIRTWSGFCYTAFVMDLYSRRIVGWSTSSRTGH